jgi:HEAT repeat protein
LSLLIGCLSLTQEPAAGLSRAALLAESPVDLPAALQLYQDLAADPKASVSDAFHAELGVIRCLRRLGRLEEARDALKRLLEGKNIPSDGRALMEAEKVRLEVTAQEEDPVRAQVIQAIQEGMRPAAQPTPLQAGPVGRSSNPSPLTAKLHQVGRAALPVLREILLGKAPEISFSSQEYGGMPTACREIVDFLLSLPGEESAKILEEVVLARSINDRLSLVKMIGVFADRNGDRRYEKVIQHASQDPNPQVRMTACQLLKTQGSVPWSIWEQLLNDETVQVSNEAIRSVVFAAGTIPEAQLFATLEGLARHANPRVRTQVARQLEVLHQKSPSDTMRLLSLHMRDDSPDVVLEAMGAASRWRSPETRDLILQALASPHGRVRSQALQFLGRPISEKERARAVELLSDAIPEVRMAASLMLRSESSAAIAAVSGSTPRLIDLLGTPGPELSTFALRVLATTADKSIAPQIVPLLRSESASTRGLAFHYIRRCDLREHADSVASSLPHQTVGRIAMDGNLSITPGPVAEWLIEVEEHRAIPKIVLALKSMDDRFHYEIARVLATRLKPEHAGQLADALLAVEDGVILKTVMPPLSKYLGGLPRARRLYGIQLKNGVPEVRRQAAWGLSAAGNPEDAEVLVAAVWPEEDAGVLEVLTGTAAKFVNDHQVGALVETWKNSDDARVRQRAMAILAQVSSKRATDAMMEALTRGGPEREQVIHVVGSNRIEEGLRIIESLLEQDQLAEDEKISAILSLGVPGRSSATQLLASVMLRDPELRAPEQVRLISNVQGDNAVRVSVHPSLIALQAIGQVHVIEAVRTIFLDPTRTKLMEQALALLAQTPDPVADQLILSALSHEHATVQKRAALVAGGILLKGSVPGLRAMLRSSNWEVRAEADRALRRLAEFGITNN